MPKRKRRLKKGALFILIVILLITIYASIVYFIVGCNINNIYIYNNNYLSDQEIIDMAKLGNYPDFYTTSSSSIKKRILSNSLVKSVKVEKKFFKEVHLTITEYQVLFKKLEDGKYVLENKKEITLTNDLTNIPILINYIPNTKYDIFVKKLTQINNDVINKISEIKYDPVALDEDRFLLYMNDENYVYITLTKFDLLNKYNDAIEQFEGKKGILYLDSGNYFQIKD